MTLLDSRLVGGSRLGAMLPEKPKRFYSATLHLSGLMKPSPVISISVWYLVHRNGNDSKVVGGGGGDLRIRWTIAHPEGRDVFYRDVIHDGGGGGADQQLVFRRDNERAGRNAKAALHHGPGGDGFWHNGFPVLVLRNETTPRKKTRVAFIRSGLNVDYGLA